MAGTVVTKYTDGGYKIKIFEDHAAARSFVGSSGDPNWIIKSPGEINNLSPESPVFKALARLR